MVYGGVCLGQHGVQTGNASTLCVQPLVVAQSVFDVSDDCAEVENLVDQGLNLVRRAADLENDFQACSCESANGKNTRDYYRCFSYGEPLWYLTIASYGPPDLVCPRTSTFELICLGFLIALMQIALHSPSDLFSISKVKNAVFAQFWLRMGKAIPSSAFPYSSPEPFTIFVLGPMFAEGDKETAVPALVYEASGVVLEIGPGIGSQLPRYNASKITKVYGVEPNIDLHESLRERVKASGLTDVYEIAPCGVEDVVELEKHGITLGSIDTVLSIQVLCSVPDPDEMLRWLYALMKPGAQFILYEHVKSKDVISVYNVYYFCVSCNRYLIGKKGPSSSLEVMNSEPRKCKHLKAFVALSSVAHRDRNGGFLP
ncbi:MAG: hypothetical protein Q9164_003449 [Protoblastenia rupestris]